MSKPVRSVEHLAFIRSLPCYPCALIGRLNFLHIEACHTPGSRGMGQKRSDLDTIPMCSTHHRYQHQVGWTAFIRKYQLYIPELLAAFRLRIKITVARNHYFAEIGAIEHNLGPVTISGGQLMAYARSAVREHLIDTLFRPLVERQRHAG